MFNKITIICSISFIVLYTITSFKLDNKLSVNDDRESPVKLYCPEPLRFEDFFKKKNILLSKDGALERETKKDNKEIDQDWYSKVIDNIEKEEYNIFYSDELKIYQSINRQNNIRFIYHNDGFTAKTMQTKIPLYGVSDKTTMEKDKKYKEITRWRIKFKTLDVRRETQDGNEKLQITCLAGRQANFELRKLNEGEIKIDKNKASIENENMRIEYTNDEKGMRQDFIIKNKPTGKGKLRLNLSADTKLKMIVGADALMFKNNHGVDKMKYSALKCWDANGRILRAYFEDNYKLQITNYKFKTVNRNSKIKNQKSFAIVVNDEDATYPITIDPLSTSPNWTVEGNTNEALGVKAATAGDVNGDGYSDVLISLGDSVIHCYYGSSTGLPVLHNWSARSFGFSSIGTAGDVNADGYSDVIIGDGAYSVQGPSNGRALAYYGSATGLPLTPNWTVYDSSNADGAQFGNSISTAGDVNGDGYSDVIVGAPYHTNDVNNEGAVFCYFGSSTGLSLTANWKVEGNSPGESYHFGEAISLAGDVNGDGYSDILVGAPNWNINRGRVYAYYGSSTGLTTQNWTTFSTQTGEVYGSSLSSAGDVNGDGYSDITIGARGYDGDSTDEGRVYVYHGSSTGLSALFNWAAEGNQYSSNFGRNVSSAGDINGDGYADILVGANFYSNTLSTQGRAFMYQGSATGLPGAANWTADGEQANSLYGSGVFTAGDVNGDGYSDVIVGAPGYSSNRGKAYLYNGAPAGLAPSDGWSGTGQTNSENFGFSVASAGDVNADGYSDVIIGAPGYVNSAVSSITIGKFYLFHGSANGLPLSANFVKAGTSAGTSYHRIGSCVATAGDVNGDGFSDVSVSFVNGALFQPQFGGVDIFYGSSSGLLTDAVWSKSSSTANDNYGFSASTAGDVNGDGYSDIIIGAWGGNSSIGKAFAYYGSPSGLLLLRTGLFKV